MELNDHSQESGTLLKIQGLTKVFPGTLALDHAEFDLRAGEIHALLGENGAGKSTLIKVLAGVYEKDGGEILWKGYPVNPAHEKLPIAFIHQDLALVDGSGPPALLPSLSMTVAENISLVAGYARRNRLIAWKDVVRQARAVLETLNSDIDPNAKVSALSLADRSIIAIARALAVKADVLVLDEPTASLPDADVAKLFDILHNLSKTGMGLIYVTHRIDEVLEIADRVTVLRDGKTVASTSLDNVSTRDLVHMIVGHSIEDFQLEVAEVRPEPVLEVKDLAIDGIGPISFSLYRGEIVCLVGLRGAGHESVGRAIFGDSDRSSGAIRVLGREIPEKDIQAAMNAGVGYLSNKRAEECLLAGLTVRENLFPNPSMPGISIRRSIGQEREHRQARQVLKAFDVRPLDTERTIETLSGGNQQKVVLARWLEAGAALMILQEPTAGVDVGARAEIYEILNRAANEGKSILIITSDFQEAARICHHAFVFNRGRLIADLKGDQLAAANITALASASYFG